MSLSSRNLAAAGRPLTAAGVVALIAAAPAGAADIYYQPIVQLSTQYNTNLDLASLPADKRGAEGYYADAATIVGIATPTTETTLEPRLLYNYYPSASDRNRLEAFLNGNGRYAWQRDRININGTFDHRDDVNAEQPGAADTNTVNPGTGNTTPTTGVTAVGVTRDYLILDPTYTHLLTPLSGIGLSGEYQRMSYSKEDGNHIGFDFYQAKLFYSRTVDLRTDFSVGVYGNYYESQFLVAHSNSGGVQANGGYNWTQTLHSNLMVEVQETQFHENRGDAGNTSVTSHPWASVFTTTYDAQTSKYTFSLGRTIYPSSAGGLYQTDQVRGQYDKDFTQRLHFTGAIRIFRDRNVSGVVNDNYRNYGTGNLRVQYMLTQRLFVATAYTYVYQKYRFDLNSADANVINVSFGYRGLDRQR
jgi:hypothetical protein